MARNFQDQLLEAFRLTLEPVANSSQDSQGPVALLESVGWQLDAIAQFPVQAFVDALRGFDTAFRSFVSRPVPRTLSELADALDVLFDLVTSARAITTALQAPGFTKPPGLDDLGKDLIDLFALTVLRRQRPFLYHTGVLLTFIQERQVEAVIDEAAGEFIRVPVTVPRSALGRIVDLLKDPVALLRAEYGLQEGVKDEATAQAASDKLFPRVADVVRSLNASAVYGTKQSYPFDFGVVGNRLAHRTLTVSVPLPELVPGQVEVGGAFLLDEIIGLAVRPFADGRFTQNIGNWAFDVGVSVGSQGIGIDSEGVTLLPGGAAAAFDVAATRLPAEEQVAEGNVGPVLFLGSETTTRLEIGEVGASIHAAFAETGRDFGFDLKVSRAAVVVKSAEGDGFLGKILPADSRIEFDLALGWSSARGVHFGASGGLELKLPVVVDIGGLISFSAIHLALRAAEGKLDIEASATGSALLGPITVSAERLGLRALLDFTAPDRNLELFDLDFGFKPPDGVGIALNAGPISGGGFISFKDGRYSGALELKVYEVRVSAFGVIDTRLPDGSRGFSFVIVISAEFTPIQLGFGFTLLGVGGVLGINRAIDEAGLRQALLSGSLENVLFPHNVTQRAPEIIDTLTLIMPPAEGRYLLGPMAKIGWGTPTLIRAEIGVLLELPGPLVTILGEIHCQLPNPERALVSLNMSVTGRIDFPQRLLEINARLRDSKVGTFTVGGQMAMRLRWGRQPSFALAIGGFHPSFQPPAGFPALQPLEVDLGRNSNPSIQLSGFFAVTSNTVQVGGALTIHASGAGISLDAIIAVKAIFVFSPFSFEAQIYAKVKISFHGRGPSVQLHGALGGPSPWRIRARLCVSILWWDACLGFNKSFGGEARIEEPTIDPWQGILDQVLGLRPALADPRSWTPAPPPGAFQVVSLAEAPPGAPESHPFDPMGLAQVRQRVLPLEGTHTRITRFGPAKSSGPDRFNLTRVQLDTEDGPLDIDFTRDVFDFFAPAQYFEMDEGKKLSAPSFQEFVAGYTISSNAQDAVVGSSSDPKDTTFETFVRDSRPSPPPPPTDTNYFLQTDRLIGQSKRSLVSLEGLGREGTVKYVEPGMRSPFTVREQRFTVTNKSNLGALDGMAPTSQWDAIFAAGDRVASSPSLSGLVQVTPLHELGGGA